VCDLAAFFDQDAVDDLSFFTGLDRDELVVQEAVGDLICPVGDIAFGDHRDTTQRLAHDFDGGVRDGIVYGSLSTATGMNLSLHDDGRNAALNEVVIGNGTSVGSGENGLAEQNGHVVGTQQFLRLILVNVHGILDVGKSE